MTDHQNIAVQATRAEAPKPGAQRAVIFGVNYAPEPSGNAPYTTGLAEYLAAAGWSVDVVTGYPHYPAWQRQPAPRNSRLGGVRIDRHRHFVPRSTNAVQRGVFELTSLLAALPAALRKRDVSVVVGVVPNLGDAALARIAAWRNRAPFALWIQDLMGPGARQSGTSGGDVVARYVERAELALARRAAVVMVAADGFRSYLEAGSVDSERIVRAHNWSTLPPPRASRTAARAAFGIADDATVVLHSGNMGHKQGLQVVLDAAELGPDLEFVLQGNGSERAELESEAAHRSLANVRFLSSLDAQQLADLLGAADVLLVAQRATVANMSLPSKLASYFATGRPVVAAVDASGETATEVSRYAGGTVVDAENPEALVSAVRSAAAMDPIGRASTEGPAAGDPETTLRDLATVLHAVAADSDGAKTQ